MLMKRRILNCTCCFIFSAASSILTISCDEIIVEDISDHTMILIAPADSTKTTQYTQTFLWEEVDEATSYNLQIVQPNYSNLNSFVLDTTVSSTNFTVNLFPGEFEWSVQALNNISQSERAFRNILIDSTLNLNSSSVSLISPQNNVLSNQQNVTFNWATLENAENYRIKIVEGVDFLTGNTVIDTLIADNSIVLTFANEGDYTWGVRAENELSNSLYNSRRISFDFTPPNVPIFLSPQNNSVVFNPTSISWTPKTLLDTDSIIFSTDSLFNNIYLSAESDSSSYSGSLTSGVNFVKLVRTDGAGNQAVSSFNLRLIVQ